MRSGPAVPAGGFYTWVKLPDGLDATCPVPLPVFVTVSVFRLRTNVAVTDLATNWGDPDGDPLFIASIGMSTTVAGVAGEEALPMLWATIAT